MNTITNNDIILFLTNSLNKYNLALNYKHPDIKSYFKKSKLYNSNTNIKISSISLFVYILDHLSLNNYYLKPNLYRKAINNILLNYRQNDESLSLTLKENLTYIINDIIYRDELELYNYFNYMCTYHKLNWVIHDTNSHYYINKIMNNALEYSLEIFYKIYEKHKTNININNLVKSHLKNNRNFYKHHRIRYNTIYQTNYFKLFSILKYHYEINNKNDINNINDIKNISKIQLTPNNKNFIEALLFFFNKIELYNIYLLNLCWSYNLISIKKLLKNRHIKMNHINWVAICKFLIESNYINNS